MLRIIATYKKLRNKVTYNRGYYWKENQTFLRKTSLIFEYLIGVTIARQQINRFIPLFIEKTHGDIIDIGGYDDKLKKLYADRRIINLDIQSGEYVDIVQDAGQMTSINSESIGGILCISVLEHASNPEEIIADIHRVLRPGGLAYISLPWMFESHMEPQDYLRFSSSWGKEKLEQFELIDMHLSNSIYGCISHFMQHKLFLRFTLGIIFFLMNLMSTPSDKFSTQIGFLLRKSEAQ